MIRISTSILCILLGCCLSLRENLHKQLLSYDWYCESVCVLVISLSQPRKRYTDRWTNGRMIGRTTNRTANCCFIFVFNVYVCVGVRLFNSIVALFVCCILIRFLFVYAPVLFVSVCVSRLLVFNNVLWLILMSVVAYILAC